jgi:hypothetical protein
VLVMFESLESNAIKLIFPLRVKLSLCMCSNKLEIKELVDYFHNLFAYKCI